MTDIALGVRWSQEVKCASVPRSSCIERLAMKGSQVILKGLREKKHEKPNTYFHFIVVYKLFFFEYVAESLDQTNHCDQCQNHFCCDRTNIVYFFITFCISVSFFCTIVSAYRICQFETVLFVYVNVLSCTVKT